MPLRIEVTGQSTISRRAERALIHLSVSSTGPSQQTVIDNVTTTSNHLQSQLKTSLAPKDSAGSPTEDAAVTHWSMSTLNTRSWYGNGQFGQAQFGQGQNAPTYNASTSFEIKFRDFERLGVAVGVMAGMPYVNITRIEWRLMDETRRAFGSQSRKQAVEDAFVKARDYAEAVGYSTVHAVQILDGQMASPVPGTFGMRAHGAVTRGGGAGEPTPEGLSFEPENVDINSSVKVVFEAE